jgi:hypothetical protein
LKKISLEQELDSVLNSKSSDDFLKEQLYQYKSIFINRVFPDASNPRFFPAIIMSNFHAKQLINKRITKQQLISVYGAEDNVIIGKSCIVNCCKYGSNEWKKANVSINSIIELGDNVAVSEIIQAPTIYPTEDGNYQILTGHRRFFAMLYANGIDSAAHFKVYNSKPILQKTKQFQENASREDLPQYGKLSAFQDAMLEMEALRHSRKKMGKKALTVKEIASTLGISMGTFDNYNVLTRYSYVIKAYENGNSTSFVTLKKLVLKLESEYKEEHQLTKLSITDKTAINNRIKKHLNDDEDDILSTKVNRSKIKQMKSQYKFECIESPYVIEKLLKTNVCELECGVDWNSVNWSDPEDVNKSIKHLLEFLSVNSSLPDQG